MNNTMDQTKNNADAGPLVSVLVPSYNHEKFIVECLDSIKESTHKRLELIVSDDGSSDRTFALAEAWTRNNAERFERAIVVQQETNLGVVKNLQFLFDSARGEYLAYLASDDMLTPSGITDRLEVLEADRGLDAVFGHCQLISESGKVLRELFLGPKTYENYALKKVLPFALLRYWGPGGPVMMLRKTAVLEGGSLGRLPDDLRFEDRYLYLRLAAQGKLRFVSCVVAKYRVLDNSMSRTPAFSEVGLRGVLSSDQKNLHLFNGLGRLYMRIQVERSQVRLKMHLGSLTALGKLYFRIVSGLLRLASSVLSRTLFLKGRLA